MGVQHPTEQARTHQYLGPLRPGGDFSIRGEARQGAQRRENGQPVRQANHLGGNAGVGERIDDLAGLAYAHIQPAGVNGGAERANHAAASFQRAGRAAGSREASGRRPSCACGPPQRRAAAPPTARPPPHGRSPGGSPPRTRLRPVWDRPPPRCPLPRPARRFATSVEAAGATRTMSGASARTSRTARSATASSMAVGPRSAAIRRTTSIDSAPSSARVCDWAFPQLMCKRLDGGGRRFTSFRSSLLHAFGETPRSPFRLRRLRLRVSVVGQRVQRGCEFQRAVKMRNLGCRHAPSAGEQART